MQTSHLGLMTTMILFSTSSLPLLSSLCTVAQCLRCMPPPGILPNLPDCRDLTNAIAYVSRLPGENVRKSWGRGLPETPDTVRLPKVYWLSDRGPTTCAVHVDVSADDYLAVDEFRLRSVGVAAERVVAQCLLRLSQIGLSYPSSSRHVYAKIIRTDSPLFPSEMLRSSTIQSLQFPNVTNLLQSVSVSFLVNTTSMVSQDE